jgi:hypothetical protein
VSTTCAGSEIRLRRRLSELVTPSTSLEAAEKRAIQVELARIKYTPNARRSGNERN